MGSSRCHKCGGGHQVLLGLKQLHRSPHSHLRRITIIYQDDIFTSMSNEFSFVKETLRVGRDHVFFNLLTIALMVYFSAPLRIPASSSSKTHEIQELAGSGAKSWICLPTQRLLYTVSCLKTNSRQALTLVLPLRRTSSLFSPHYSNR
jgi:hypothetical protein